MTKINFFKSAGLFLAFLSIGVFTSCSEDDGTTTIGDDPIASFQFEVSASNFLEVTFSNFSQNATSYSWDFGDGSAANTTESPVYEYAEAGTYSVTLTAANDEGTSKTKTEVVTITDPLEAERALIGESGKVWQLVGDNSTGANPLEVGPADRSQVWFALADLCSRECIFDDTWTFNTDGTFTFENNGDAFAEGGVFKDFNEVCFDASVTANYTGPNGEDLSDWNSGTHDFNFDPSASTLTITGGFIGLMKVGTSDEALTPEASVTYKVNKLVEVENSTDTLVLETSWTTDDGTAAYWQFTLVSYNSASDAVVVEECEVVEKTVIDAINIDFESNAPTWGTFGGPASDGNGVDQSTVANPVSGGINTSATVSQVDEADGSQGWSGISTTLDGYVDFSTKQTIKVKVYSPFAGAVIKFKLEDSADANNNKEIDLTTTAANTWEELSFTFAAEDSEKWNVLVMFFDFKGEAKAGARTHYFDDIILE